MRSWLRAAKAIVYSARRVEVLEALLVAATVAAVVAFRASLWAWATTSLSPPAGGAGATPCPAVHGGGGGQVGFLRCFIKEGIAMSRDHVQ